MDHQSQNPASAFEAVAPSTDPPVDADTSSRTTMTENTVTAESAAETTSSKKRKRGGDHSSKRPTKTNPDVNDPSGWEVRHGFVGAESIKR